MLKIFPAICLVTLGLLLASMGLAESLERVPVSSLQQKNAETNRPQSIHWGPNEKKYSSWTNHSNRLIPIYTFGIDLDAVDGVSSVYRSEEKLEKLFGYLPAQTVNSKAEYFDQTDVYRLQKQAAESGKKRIILFIYDGMDWQTTWAAAIYKSGRVPYREGRGAGLHFQDYRGAKTDFGYFVTTPHNNGTDVNVDRQIVTSPGGSTKGGYDVGEAGEFPWSVPADAYYPIAKGKNIIHAFTDSASSATSMTSGIKTYNNAINVDYMGREVLPISRQLQADGWKIGVVTSVPVCHATPGAAYANNVHRYDYQDITRDLIGRPSVYHPGSLPGVDVLIGGGWGDEKTKDGKQGQNFVPGNPYITQEDLQAIDVANGGKYVIAQRTPGQAGKKVLDDGAAGAIKQGHRLFGFFGIGGGHLPFQTADGKYDPVVSAKSSGPVAAEKYSAADLRENVTLADMSIAALDVLEAKGQPWWLMIEAGDVDWANHSNNIDDSIGAVLSGDEAFHQVTQWIETHGGWDDTCLILTADHGHYLVIEDPEALTGE
ncbi:Alkaline phosphatase 4 precursor [Bremerella volcania]|uniref:Alkaline phosphatase 4 n=1 Tax=Bremerella volcania TaxID=2527984 RepID=A0A518C1I6_9BACT|nr:alkaline phosphatase [Bremerella volcania]QDU73089.1 Alkaline phosphatase 4 precursor [Bremerella volcania]